MSTLRQFSEKEQNYHEYQARQEFLRQQRTILIERDQAKDELAAALKDKETALAEVERLKALLAKNNLNS